MASTTEHNPYAPPAAVRPDPPTPVGKPQGGNMVAVVLTGVCAVLIYSGVLSFGNALGLIVLAFLSLPFLVGPIQLHRNYWLALEPTAELFDPAASDTPPVIAQRCSAADEALGRHGFARVMARRLLDSSPNATGYALIYRHPETLEVARVVTTLVRTSRGEQGGSALGFATAFTDGTEVVSGTRGTPRIFPPFPAPHHAAIFPGIDGHDRLRAAHRAHVAEHEAGRIRVDPLGGDPAAALRKDHRRLVDHLVATKYAWNDESAGRQRLTWKGAILVTWKLTPPIKQIRLALERHAARRHLARLEGR